MPDCYDHMHDFIISRYHHVMTLFNAVKSSYHSGSTDPHTSVYHVRTVLYAECDQLDNVVSSLDRKISRFESQITASVKVIFVFTY